MAKSKKVAIYTRKSTGIGPDKEANSLTVQRGATESFVKIRGQKDWEILKERFDDKNASGATMDRPAMNRLIQWIKDGKVDVVAIHRMDRISRSLLDFLELLQFLEKHNVAFICATQNFDTSDPVGRMSAQMLLAMAEFERTLIRDRVTERMHAARRLGRFIGGRPILGYNIKPKGRELEVDEIEAIRVREIFELYLKLRSVKAVVLELKKRNWTNKRWVTKEGKVTGGSAFTTSTLHNLLTNKTYIGRVSLKGEVFEGQHDGIVDLQVFEKVQTQLARNDVQKGNRNRNSHDALLKGLLKCKACGTAFVHTGTKTNSKTYC